MYSSNKKQTIKKPTTRIKNDNLIRTAIRNEINSLLELNSLIIFSFDKYKVATLPIPISNTPE
ncbi:hypothetical protein NUITMVA1_16170 [Aeromonas hydrophila]|nr:hypothetical protein NUITMVA1_16170 [Aeromonas hydrophila]